MWRALSARNLATSSRELRSQSGNISRRAGSMKCIQTWLRAALGTAPKSPNSAHAAEFHAR